jgi:hypothetical protein
MYENSYEALRETGTFGLNYLHLIGHQSFRLEFAILTPSFLHTLLR